MSPTDYSSETLDRIKKLDRIRTLGVNPYATRFDITDQIISITSKYQSNINTETGEMNPFRSVEEVIISPKDDIALAGRIILHRSFGKICFATISDGTAKIQVLFSRENCSINVNGESKTELTGEKEPVTAYKFAEKLIDLGDFIGVS